MFRALLPPLRFATLPLVAALAGCGEPRAGAVRAGDQPLETLVTAEAQRRVAAAANANPGQSQQAAGMCQEVLRVSEQGTLILDRTQPGRLLVNRDLWSRVPPGAQQAIVRCAELVAAADGRGGRLAVVATAPAAP